MHSWFIFQLRFEILKIIQLHQFNAVNQRPIWMTFHIIIRSKFLLVLQYNEIEKYNEVKEEVRAHCRQVENMKFKRYSKFSFGCKFYEIEPTPL